MPVPNGDPNGDLNREINAAWQNRKNITPSTKGTPRPQIIEILKHLPRTNCRECGEPTCMVFATRLAEGAKGVEDCPPIRPEDRQFLEVYLGRFDVN